MSTEAHSVDIEPYKRGPIQEFEIVWRSGHSEVIRAHQVSYRGTGFFTQNGPEVVEFHGEFHGRWLLVLRALGADLRTVRNLTQTEQAPTGPEEGR